MLALMGDVVSEVLSARIDAGGVEQIGDHPFVELVTLESEARYGLSVGSSGEARWAQVNGDRLISFAPETARFFVEVLEHERSAFDDLIMGGAEGAGLPGTETLLSFPAVELVSAIVETRSAHFVRLGLLWLLPSELRLLREEIVAICQDSGLPQTLRDLAGRLVVPA